MGISLQGWASRWSGCRFAAAVTTATAASKRLTTHAEAGTSCESCLGAKAACVDGRGSGSTGPWKGSWTVAFSFEIATAAGFANTAAIATKKSTISCSLAAVIALY